MHGIFYVEDIMNCMQCKYDTCQWRTFTVQLLLNCNKELLLNLLILTVNKLYNMWVIVACVNCFIGWCTMLKNLIKIQKLIMLTSIFKKINGISTISKLLFILSFLAFVRKWPRHLRAVISVHCIISLSICKNFVYLYLFPSLVEHVSNLLFACNALHNQSIHAAK